MTLQQAIDRFNSIDDCDADGNLLTDEQFNTLFSKLDREIRDAGLSAEWERWCMENGHA